MRLITRILAVLVLGLIATTAIMLSGCGSKESTIPITASSDKAREAYVKGREYAENLRLNEAREYFQRAVEADSEFALAYLALAQTQATTNEFYEAFNQARARVNRISDGERLLIQVVEAGISGETRLQEELLTELTDKYPLDKRAHMALGNFLFGQQLFQRAIAEYRKIKTLDPDFAPPYNQAGYAFRSLGKYKEAEEAFKTYIRLIPNDPNPYDSYAELLMKMGEFSESNESYRRALRLDSSFAASYFGIASNLAYLGKYDSARQVLEVMYQRATNEGSRRNALAVNGLVWADEGKLDQSLEEFHKMLAIGEQMADSGTVSNDLLLISLIHVARQDWTAATACLDRQINATENCDLDEAAKKNLRRANLSNRAVVAIAQGDLTDGKQWVDQYWTEVENLGTRLQLMNGHALYGRLALAQKNWTEAIAQLEQSSLQNVENLYRLALAYQGGGNRDRALTTAESAAHWNQPLTLNYSLSRKSALALLDELEK